MARGEALAATFASLILLGACVRYAVSAAVAAYETQGAGIAPETLYATAPLWAGWAAVAVLALRGARTVASAGVVAVAVVTLAVYPALDPSSLSAEGNASVPILLGAVIVAGLLGSRGTPVGPRLLARRTFAIALCAAVGLGVVAVAHAFTWFYLPEEALKDAYLGPALGARTRWPRSWWRWREACGSPARPPDGARRRCWRSRCCRPRSGPATSRTAACSAR
ncbi:hypothetical protein ACFQHO_41510 [Actinomadura yumaensis]|uniref:hypothetical protein n=1 Tax=Actinomadura yumaensis TaxID=111807 RepID=UPI003614AD32